MSCTLHVNMVFDWWCAWVFKTIIRMIMWGCLKVSTLLNSPTSFIGKRMCQWCTRRGKVNLVSCYLAHFILVNKKRTSKRDALTCWDTRTRTKNDRTRICSVTITPYPNACFALQRYYFFRIFQTIYKLFCLHFTRLQQKVFGPGLLVKRG